MTHRLMRNGISMKWILGGLAVITIGFFVIVFKMPDTVNHDDTIFYPLFVTFYGGYLHGGLILLYVIVGLLILSRWRKWSLIRMIGTIFVLGVVAFSVFMMWVLMDTASEQRQIIYNSRLYRLVVYYDNSSWRGTDVNYVIYDCNQSGTLCHIDAIPYTTTTAPRNSQPDNITPLPSRFIVDVGEDALYIEIGDERYFVTDEEAHILE